MFIRTSALKLLLVTVSGGMITAACGSGKIEVAAMQNSQYFEIIEGCAANYFSEIEDPRMEFVDWGLLERDRFEYLFTYIGPSELFLLEHPNLWENVAVGISIWRDFEDPNVPYMELTVERFEIKRARTDRAINNTNWESIERIEALDYTIGTERALQYLAGCLQDLQEETESE